MSDPKIFIFAPVDQADECHQKLEKYGCELLKGQAGWHSPQGDNEQDMVAMAKEADALMGTSIRSSPITRSIMESSPNLRVVAKCTVGTDDIDVDAATELGILVCHAPTESNCYGVAEGTVAFILATIKKLNQRDAAVKSGGWRDPRFNGPVSRSPDDRRLSRPYIRPHRIGPNWCPRRSAFRAMAYANNRLRSLYRR